MQHQYTTVDRGTDGTNESTVPANETSNIAANQRTVATSVLTAGTSALIGTMTSPAEERSSVGRYPDVQKESEPDRLVLVPIHGYRPGMTVRVVDRLPAPIVVQLLRLPNDETVPVLRRPDEYSGYVVRAEFRGDFVYSTMVVFTRESLESDARYTFEADAQVFSVQLSLFQTTARRISSADDGGDNPSESSSGRR